MCVRSKKTVRISPLATESSSLTPAWQRPTFTAVLAIASALQQQQPAAQTRRDYTRPALTLVAFGDPDLGGE